jgi:hypothetical protein
MAGNADRPGTEDRAPAADMDWARHEGICADREAG